jgi:hypothetical protein
LSLPSARRPPVLCISGGRAVQARTHGAKGLAIASQFADKRRCFARPLIRAGAKLSLLHRLAEVHSAYWECHVLKARSARESSFACSALYARRSLTTLTLMTRTATSPAEDQPLPGGRRYHDHHPASSAGWPQSRAALSPRLSFHPSAWACLWRPSPVTNPALVPSMATKSRT